MPLTPEQAERVKKAARGLLDLANFEERLAAALEDPGDLGVAFPQKCNRLLEFAGPCQWDTTMVKDAFREFVERLPGRLSRPVRLGRLVRLGHSHRDRSCETLHGLVGNPTNLGALSSEEFVSELEVVYVSSRESVESTVRSVQHALAEICATSDWELLARENWVCGNFGDVPEWLLEVKRPGRATVCHEPLLTKLRKLRVSDVLLRDLGVDLSVPPASASAP